MSTLLAPSLRQRVARLRWALPLAIGLLAVGYELGPGRWIHDYLGAGDYFDLDILFYATAAPLLAFWVLSLISQWLDERDRAEVQARATEQRLASVMAASADAILALDAAGRIAAWNAGAELIFGYPAEAMLGRPLTELLLPGEAAEVELRWLMDDARRAGFVRGHETTGRDQAGRTLALELTLTRLGDPAGPPAGWSVILRDVSDRQRREAEIHRLNASLNEQVAERTRELGQKVAELARANTELQKLDQTRSEFVSLVSHQIRAPLTNIRGAVELMGSDCAAVNATCGRMFTIMNQQAERLDHLVRDVLSAARLEAGEMLFQAEPTSLLPVAQQVAEQMRARAGGTRGLGRPIQLPTKPGLPLVLADRDRVAEVLANLLDNADKYSPPGEPVVIDLRADQTEVTVTVTDAGHGLPPGALDHVFDKFYRGDNSDSQAVYGYGLGLYVCRRLIEAQGGRIWAENGPRGGAVFSFTLPVAAALAPSAAIPPSAALAPGAALGPGGALAPARPPAPGRPAPRLV
jgi:PAS domain S-box-containing protein